MSANVTTTSGPAPNGVRADMAFRVINKMVADGVLKDYAIGGATAAFFYIEPDTTYDVDIFCVVEGVEPDAMTVLEPIYDYLRGRNFEIEGVAVIIHGVAVQFLPVYNSLNEEAVQEARKFSYQGVQVRVMKPEHLVAIMLQTGRSKDYARVARFLEADAFDADILRQTLTRHGLKGEWTKLGVLQRRLAR
jgi:hypothetical protein